MMGMDQKVFHQRITKSEALNIFLKEDLHRLGKMAMEVRWRIHPERKVTFLIDRNINYTNICVSQCRFCAFYRSKGDSDAYVICLEELFRKIEETLSLGGTGILMQGGLHPDLPLSFYVNLIRQIKKRYPSVHLHAFSPPEIVHMARLSGMGIRDVLQSLRDAGLDSIPGGGAEILSDRVRSIISPRKIRTKEWLEVMREAHRMGIPTSATMMFGSVETAEEIIEHLDHIRNLQDETGGFISFIPWSYQPGGTRLGGVCATGVEYLRVLAISRIYLDNVVNIQASWVTQGTKMAQMALFFGANDFGSVMLEENVVAATGVRNRTTVEEIVRLIKDASFIPVQRTHMYHTVRIF
ncbi:MAG: cyclic dehypoxanthinyl futalosine synthase [Candidatus Aenigmatarchaeota archaeon]